MGLSVGGGGGGGRVMTDWRQADRTPPHLSPPHPHLLSIEGFAARCWWGVGGAGGVVWGGRVGGGVIPSWEDFLKYISNQDSSLGPSDP